MTGQLDNMPASEQQLETLRQLALHLGERIQRPKTFGEAQEAISRMSRDLDEMRSRKRAS